jgi:hypothetical protein
MPSGGALCPILFDVLVWILLSRLPNPLTIISPTELEVWRYGTEYGLFLSIVPDFYAAKAFLWNSLACRAGSSWD